MLKTKNWKVRKIWKNSAGLVVNRVRETVNISVYVLRCREEKGCGERKCDKIRIIQMNHAVDVCESREWSSVGADWWAGM